MSRTNDLRSDDGGPAFPRPLSLYKPSQLQTPQLGDYFSAAQGGMSLRDWFAGQALAGDMATMTTTDARFHAERIAERCYLVADALLAERAKRKEES
jgi:hypothetical protein